jgi:hypothetical protein
MDPLDRALSEVAPLIEPARIAQDIAELGRIEQRTDFGAFAASAAYLNKRFTEIGLESQILRFPADGRARYHCWTAPIGFCTTQATCEIVEPQACARVLGDRDLEPNTAIVGTGHTGPGGVVAEVVHLKAPADIAGVDIAGKVIYCSDFSPSSIRQEAVAKGAQAVVSSFTKDRTRNHHYVPWVNTWDTQADGWLPTAQAAAENLPGISISPEMGDYLEACLAKGPVTLRIVTEGSYFESEMLGVNAVLPGQQEREVLLTGHLFEQGLVDNASGVMIGFTVSEILQELQRRQGTPPLRGLRNFHSQECYGVLALSQYHAQIPARAFAHLDMDMIGRGGFALIKRPGLLVSMGFSDFLLRLILERARQWVPHCSYELENSFQINCTILAEPALGGISTSLLEQGNPEWHTSHDREGVQALDHDVLRYTTLVAAAWAYFLTTAGDREAEWLLAEYQSAIQADLDGAKIADTQIYFDLKGREMASIALIVSPAKRADLLAEVNEYVATKKADVIEGNTITPQGTKQEVEESVRLYPKTVLGGPAVAACFSEEQLQDIGSPKWSSVQLVLKSWADGTRSIHDITRLAIYETGAQLDLAYTLAFFEHYAHQGIVTWQP